MNPTQPPQPPPLPPACADCVTLIRMAQQQAGIPPALQQPIPTRLLRAADGKMRVDAGQMSTILDPARKQTILLDHVKKEAQILPSMDQMPAGLLAKIGPPPQIPGIPQPPPAKIEDLGKALIDGHEVMGKRITFQPPQMPQAPGVPQAPKLPLNPPAVAEVWTSTKYQLPVLTKTKLPSGGEYLSQCKFQDVGEPAAAAFQIPPDYKPVQVPLPDPPKPPVKPQLPKAPRLPV